MVDVFFLGGVRLLRQNGTKLDMMDEVVPGMIPMFIRDIDLNGPRFLYSANGYPPGNYCNISHQTGKGKSSSNIPLAGDMLVPWRVTFKLLQYFMVLLVCRIFFGSWRTSSFREKRNP